MTAVLEPTPAPAEPEAGPKPLTTGKQSVGIIIALWAFVVIPFVALIAAVPVAWGWGLSWLDVAMFLVGTSTAVPHIKSGALRGLAVTSRKRVDGLPDVPTFAEAGLPGVDVSLWFAVLVPSGTAAAIVKKLNADIAQVVADPEFKQALAVRGFEAVSSSPQQLAEFLEKDYVKFRDLIGRLGLQVD